MRIRQEEEEVVFTRENRGGSTQHATRATPEVVFIRGVNTNEDSPNARRRRRRRRQSLFMV
jgi:hypothetical protein